MILDGRFSVFPSKNVTAFLLLYFLEVVVLIITSLDKGTQPFVVCDG